jgi:hypothetical protein
MPTYLLRGRAATPASVRRAPHCRALAHRLVPAKHGIIGRRRRGVSASSRRHRSRAPKSTGPSNRSTGDRDCRDKPRRRATSAGDRLSRGHSSSPTCASQRIEVEDVARCSPPHTHAAGRRDTQCPDRPRRARRTRARCPDAGAIDANGDIEGFVRWFADWWLRRGRELAAGGDHV